MSEPLFSSCVVLLHGLVRSSFAMSTMAKALQKRGFYTVNQGYPSRQHSIEKLANIAIDSALEKCPKDLEISFVTHSLGGILVRQYLSQRPIKKLKRVIMLGPPNQGSEVVDKLGALPGFKLLNGDAGMQLGTGCMSVPIQLGAANFDVGIIAGTKSVNWMLSTLIPGVDDGKVSVQSTKLEGMRDHIELPVTHPFMMNDKRVINQVVYYLEHGYFLHTD